ncbi:uncharacterized protein LTR77_004097 [Saxophila tyrrhenica]|uniref:Uncharacterized protein n=1 Tax=Saxophila tyrrhenica TaxID=1690608 RepID=A0AAV9PG03_9PEZI|nr:hypothetical protein LTR77_004097 [Saxophila tyrrhenica]
MHLSTTVLTFLAIGANFSLASPARGVEKHLTKRDTCTLVGWVDVQGDFSNGRAPDPGDVTSGFDLYYVGGVQIGSSSFENGGSSPIGIDGVTIPQEEIGSGESIMWWANYFVGFQSCRISYEGIEYEGYMNGAINPCAGRGDAGEDCSYCSADFGCESNL